MSTLKTTNLQHASAASAAIVLASDSTATLNGLAYPTSGSLSGRNRIINGDMRIDQRNAGASVTPNGSYTLDRWLANNSQTGKYTVQQNAGSVTPPAGFTNYLGVTSTSAYSLSSTDYFWVGQLIEGFNLADLAWGTASAKSITISFWVYSSLTGTFSGGLRNSGVSRSYGFNYTINSANTWEQKTVTIAGETTGTWLTNNGIGVRLQFGLGVGSTYTQAAGSWTSGNYDVASGGQSIVGTNGATFYITGVQVEAGSVATPFERRSYGQELALCQRYYWTGRVQGFGIAKGTVYDGFFNFHLPVTMRAAPTVPTLTSMSNSSRDITGTSTVGPASGQINGSYPHLFEVNVQNSTANVGVIIVTGTGSASAEL